MGGAAVRVTVLGLVQLIVSERSVPLTRYERTLLAGVAVQDGRTASASALAEWIWADGFHASPRNRVQALVSGLRRKTAGQAQIFLTESSGYRLAPHVSCDLSEWNRLRKEMSNPELADGSRRGLLHQATGLAHGAPLDGCEDSPAVSLQRRLIEEERLRLLGDRIDSDIGAGHHDGLVAELTGLSAEHPFHEPFTAQLMDILALGGRQAEALAAYRAAYLRLDEELGVRPGTRLTQTHARVLRGTTSGGPQGTHADADLRFGEPTSHPAAPRTGHPTVPPTVPRTVPRSLADLVGRDEELAAILCERDPAARPAVVSITGLGGMGKSTLAIEAAHRLRDAFPDGSLYLALDSQTGRGGPSSVLELFLGLLGVRSESIPESLDARAALFRSVLDERRVLIVLDDVPDGFDIGDLLPARPSSMAILTSRRPITGAAPTQQVRLTSLNAADAVALLGSLLGTDRAEAESEDFAVLAQTCAGMPLLLKVIAQRLVRRPDIPLGRAARALAQEIAGESDIDDGDRTVQAGLGLAEAPLPESTRVILREVAALPFSGVSRWVFAALAGSEAGGDRALDQLVDSSFVDPVLHQGHSPQYQLHDLVRLHARRGAATSQCSSFPARASTASVAGRFLELTASHAAVFPAQLLPAPPDEHGARSGVGVEVPRTPEDALRFFRTEHHNLLICAREVAGSQPAMAWRLLALTGNYARGAVEPGLWIGIAQDIRGTLAGHGRDGDRGQAYLDLVEALIRHESADSSSIPLATRARRALLLDGDLSGALVAAVLLGRAHRAAGERTQAEEALTWAAQSCGPDTPAETRGYIDLAWGSLLDEYDQLRSARDHLVPALALFETTTDWSGMATTELALARVLRRLGEYAEGLPLCDAAMARFGRLGDHNGRTAALDGRADLLVQMGNPGGALPDAQLAVDLSAQHRDSFILHRAQRTLGRAYAGLGLLDQAESALSESAQGFEQLGRPLSLAGTLRDIGRVIQIQGRVDEARAVFVRERDCLVRAGLEDLSEIDALIARLDARRGGHPAAM